MNEPPVMPADPTVLGPVSALIEDAPGLAEDCDPVMRLLLLAYGVEWGAALTLPCPRCEVDPGTWCVTKFANRAERPHKARIPSFARHVVEKLTLQAAFASEDARVARIAADAAVPETSGPTRVPAVPSPGTRTAVSVAPDGTVTVTVTPTIPADGSP